MFRSQLAAVCIFFLFASAEDVSADVTFFINDAAGFAAAVVAVGPLNLAGTEDFEGSTLAPGSVGTLNDSLAPGTANTNFPSGSLIDAGVIVQSNTVAGNPVTPQPRGNDSLSTASVGFFGTPSDQIGNNYQFDSLDLMFTPGNNQNVRGVGLAPLFVNESSTTSTQFSSTLEIRVYEADNSLLGSTQIINSVDYSATAFFGVVTTNGDLIGRINIWDQDAAQHWEGADNIEVWTSVNLPVELMKFEVD